MAHHGGPAPRRRRSSALPPPTSAEASRWPTSPERPSSTSRALGGRRPGDSSQPTVWDRPACLALRVHEPHQPRVPNLPHPNAGGGVLGTAARRDLNTEAARAVNVRRCKHSTSKGGPEGCLGSPDAHRHNGWMLPPIVVNVQSPPGPSWWATALISLLSALIGIAITASVARRREHQKWLWEKRVDDHIDLLMLSIDVRRAVDRMISLDLRLAPADVSELEALQQKFSDTSLSRVAFVPDIHREHVASCRVAMQQFIETGRLNQATAESDLSEIKKKAATIEADAREVINNPPSFLNIGSGVAHILARLQGVADRARSADR